MTSALRSSSKHYDGDDGSSFHLTRNHQAIFADYSQISRVSPSSSSSKYAAYDNNNSSLRDKVRISFELHDPNTKSLTNTFVYPDKKCPLGEVRDGVLPPFLI
jgi:hypothetical protein